MIDKAWRNVNPTTIYNCFRKCGFKQTENVEQSSEPPKITNSDSGWGLLPNYGELTFEDYAHVDDDISVHGALTDAELLNLAPLDEDEEENEEEQPPIPVTLSEARRSLTTLRFYALRTDTSDDFFAALTTIENSLDNDRLKSLTQQKITDFFSK